jgi:hypothetical protein
VITEGIGAAGPTAQIGLAPVNGDLLSSLWNEGIGPTLRNYGFIEGGGSAGTGGAFGATAYYVMGNVGNRRCD